jgi:hypothetical protein
MSVHERPNKKGLTKRLPIKWTSHNSRPKKSNTVLGKKSRKNKCLLQ